MEETKLSIRSELLSIQHATPDNILHAADVVEWAQANSESALHRSIQWDDRKAAHEYRLWQVRQLITIHVVQEDSTPLLVSLSIDRIEGGGYRSISDVLPVPDLRAIMLADALAELQRVQAKYQRVEELQRVWQEAESARREQQQPRTRQRRGARQTAVA